MAHEELLRCTSPAMTPTTVNIVLSIFTCLPSGSPPLKRVRRIGSSMTIVLRRSRMSVSLM